MRFQASLALLPLLTLASKSNDIHIFEIPAEIAADLAGLTAMSRCIWLQVKYAGGKESAKEAAADIVSEIVLEADALMLYNHTIGSSKPIEDKYEQRQLYSSYGGWELQTLAFLKELAESGDQFQGTGFEDAMAGNLTTLQNSAEDFADDFLDLLPDLKTELGKGSKQIGKAFEKAISAIKPSGDLYHQGLR